MRVVLFGTYDTGTSPRLTVLGEGLRRHGVQVVECTEPLRLDGGVGSRRRNPLRLGRALLRLLRCWLALAGRARRLPRPDVVLVGHRGYLDLHLCRILFPRVPLLLDHGGGATRAGRPRDVGERVLARAQRAALRAAHLIVVDTEEHRRLLPTRCRDRGLVVTCGAPEEWFRAARPAEAAKDEGPLRVVFPGVSGPVHGTPVVATAVGQLAGFPIEITMIGAGSDHETAWLAASQNPGVRWLAGVRGEELPDLVAEHDVCLGAFGTSPTALRVVPGTVYQGAAAGCAIVTSDTVPQRRELDGSAVLVPPGDTDALADALRRLANDPREVVRLRRAARALADERFGPEQVVAPLLERLSVLCRSGG